MIIKCVASNNSTSSMAVYDDNGNGVIVFTIEEKFEEGKTYNLIKEETVLCISSIVDNDPNLVISKFNKPIDQYGAYGIKTKPGIFLPGVYYPIREIEKQMEHCKIKAFGH